MNNVIKYKLLTPTAKPPVIAYNDTDNTMGIDMFTSEDVYMWQPPKVINAPLENVIDGLRDLYTEVVPVRNGPASPDQPPVSVFVGDQHHPHPSILPYANIPTGIAIQLPPRVHLSWGGRSGLSFSEGRMPFEGKIDSNFRGELGLKLWSMNPDHQGLFIPAGTKIAQLVIIEYSKSYSLQQALELNETNRGAKGFGSTGK